MATVMLKLSSLCRRSCLIGCCVGLTLTPAWAQSPDQPLAPLAPAAIAEIRKLVADLDSDVFVTRERASQALQRLDERVIPFLEEATASPSAEVRMRAAALLKVLRIDPLDAFCALPESKLDVELGMFLIAQIIDPKVKQADLTRQLDEIANKVRAKLGKDVKPAAADPQVVVTALRQVIFEDLKFTGNTEAYRHIDNCSLERVLATRKGLPITLSRLVMLVARRLAVPIVGVPASGQYLVRYDGAQAPAGFTKDDIYFHPFLGGKVLSREDRQMMYPNHNPDVMVPPDTNRAALIRMLNNVETALEGDGTQAEKLTRAQRMMELLQSHQPGLR